jgi:hypothetical protein
MGMCEAGFHRSLRAAAAGVAAAAVLLFLLAAAPAGASVGVGVGAAPLRLAEPARPGGHYRLASLYVVNTGTRAGDYLVRVQRVGRLPGRAVPASWVHLGRARLRLRASQHTLIPVTLTVPDDAASGAYGTDLVASTVLKRPGHGTALGAAAADRLIFTVDAPGRGFSWPAWAGYLLLALAGATLAVLAARRVGLRIHIERRSR